MESNRRKGKITKVSIVDQVCDNLKEDIRAGVWAAGDKLPSEAELADNFGVNRLSVRMALQKLNALGLIETRIGEGSYVKAFSIRPFVDEVSLFYSGKEKYREVRQLREILEGECIRIAAESATSQDLERLEKALDTYDAQAAVYRQDRDDTQALEKLVDADFGFHCAIVAASHNELFQDIYYMVQKIVREHISKLIYIRTHEISAESLRQIDAHRKIYTSILSGDYEAGMKASRQTLGVDLIEGLEKKRPFEE